jgi:serine/threonine protein kinase
MLSMDKGQPLNPSPAQPEPSDLDSALLARWLREFEEGWDEGALARRTAELPTEKTLRQRTLVELVKVDLKCSWQRGLNRVVDFYLNRYPELGASLETVRDLGQVAEQAQRQAAGGTWGGTSSTLGQADGTVAPVQLVDNRYHLIKKLGVGGMGEVYLADDTRLGRRVALKMPDLHPKDGPDVRKRFEREGKAAAMLRHRNLCPVYDVGDHRGRPYLTMAYIEGQTLAEVVADGQRLPQRRAATLVRKLALALHFAHRHNVIHRDLKPANIMLDSKDESDGDEEPMVVDFGLARNLEQQGTLLTQLGAIHGTPAYMSPEQLEGDPQAVHAASDVYSLGVILYELLTGEPPFRGTMGQIIAGILTKDPQPPRALCPALDPALEGICLKAMAKQEGDRFPSMSEFAKALQDFLNTSGKSAQQAADPLPVGSPRLPRLLQRLAIPVVLLLVTVAGLWGYRSGLADVDPDRLASDIFQRWYGWADEQRRNNELNEAEQTLAALAKHYEHDAQKKSEIEALKREIARDRVRLPVRRGLTENTLPSLKAAAGLVMGKEGKPLEADERARLREQLEKAWMRRVDRQTTVAQKRKHLEELRDLLKSQIAVERLAALDAGQSTTEAIAATLRFPQPTLEEVAARRNKLESLRAKPLEEPDRERLETLLLLLDLAEQSARAPRGPALQTFEVRLSKDTKITPADREALKPVAEWLFGRRVAQGIATLPEQGEWAERASDCRKAGNAPGSWVVACRVESLGELIRTGTMVTPSEWQKAQRTLWEHRPAPEAEAYVSYVRALVSERAEQGATLVMRAFDGKGLPPELQSPRRRERAGEILQAAARELRKGGSFRDPLGGKANADSAFSWLELAYRLAGATADNRLRRDLVLAAWFRTKPATARAGEIVPALVRKEALAEVTPQEAVRLVLIHAQTRDPSLAGSKAALVSYRTALDLVCSVLRDKKVTRAERVALAHPVCELFHADVIKPLRSSEGTAPFRALKDEQIAADAARLCAATAEALRTDLLRWGEVKQLGEDWLQAVVELYHQAHELAPDRVEKAEYIVQEAYAYYARPNPSLQQLQTYAALVKTTAPEYAGSFALNGIAQIYDSRVQLDWKVKLRLLEDADRQFDEAVKRCDKLDAAKQHALQRLLYGSIGVTCLELGNYASTRNDKRAYLQRGARYAKQLLEIDPGNLEGWDNYGLLLEDLGELGLPEEYYEKAHKALTQAMDEQALLDKHTKPWLGRGRVQYRWATLGGKVRADRLAAAAQDFQKVLDWGGESVEVAEAYLWLARLYVLRGESQLASQAYAAGLALTGKASLAKQSGMALWREELLREGSEWALNEAATLRKAGADVQDVRTHVNLAEARARELEKFSKPRAAWFLLSVVRSRAALKAPAVDYRGELLKAFARGLEKQRLQDEGWYVKLLLARAELYLLGTEVPQDLRQALKDALAARQLAEQSAYVFPDAKGTAVGLAAEIRFEMWSRDKGKQLPEPLDAFREAIALAPKHERASRWKASLAAALFSKAERTQPLSQKADLLAEAAQHIAAAYHEKPAYATKEFHEYIKGWRSAIDKKALEILQKAADSKSAARAVEAWRWQWQLAELLAAEKSQRAAALTSIRRAQQALPPNVPTGVHEGVLHARLLSRLCLPAFPNVPAEYRARIRALRESLEGGK